MAALHPFLTKDAHYLLEAFAPREEKVHERAETLRRVKDAVATEKGETDVLDTSMRVYASDVDVAPLDLAVVDTQYPRGRPPQTGGSPNDDADTVSKLTAALLAQGIDGTIPSSTSTRGPISQSHTPHDPAPASRITTDIPWSAYTNPEPARTEFVYPVTLNAQTPEPFTLTPPAPTFLPLIELLQSYTAISEHIRQTVALAYIWLRSWDVRDITPLALTLLVVKYIQETEGVKPLQPDEGENARMVWVRYNAYNRRQKVTTSEIIQLDASFRPPPPPSAELANRRLGPAFLAFLKWFTQKSFHSKTPVNISIHTPRTLGASLPTTNPVWQEHQLVLRDPFVPTYNHAASISRPILFHTFVVASTAVAALSRGTPLSGVFGPYLLPPRAPAWFSQARVYYKTRPRSQFLDELEAPAPTPRTARTTTLRRVEAAIKGRYGPRFSIGLFGSTQYGVDAPTSDLDLVVIDADRMEGFAPGVRLKRLPAIYNVQDLATTLRKRGFRILRVIPQASVPIVKFFDPDTGLHCDINVNDQLGIHNTALIRAYCDLHPVVRPVVRALKRWARPLGLNDPGAAKGAASLSSYALVLMVVGRMQMRGLLPNLQDPTGMEEDGRRGLGTDTQSFWLRMRDGTRLQCDTRWRRASRVASAASDSATETDLQEALVDWFRYWGHEHRYEHDVLSIRDGGLVPREVPPALSLGGTGFAGIVPFSGVVPDPANGQGKARAGRKKGERGEEGQVGEHDGGEAEVVGDGGVEDVDPAAALEDGNVGAGGADGGTTAVGSVGGRKTADSDSGAETEGDASVFDDTEVEPKIWAKHALVVADPFIRPKNATGAVSPGVVQRFRDECRRAHMLLAWGAALEDVLLPDVVLDPVQVRGEGARARGRGRGRGRGAGRGAATGDAGRGRNESGGVGGNGERGKSKAKRKEIWGAEEREGDAYAKRGQGSRQERRTVEEERERRAVIDGPSWRGRGGAPVAGGRREGSLSRVRGEGSSSKARGEGSEKRA